jgi:tetratricopeptide (TPR) repeat protein
MPEKKNPTQEFTERRMSKPQASQANNLPGSANPAPLALPTGVAAGPPNQFTSFEAAMKLFHARQFTEARDLFVLAARGPERDVANRAQLHLAMCERRLHIATVTLGSAEDYYNYGVALINSRNLPEARAHLEKALEMSPAADHVHYALALAQALAGDLLNAQRNLKRAIELEPRNRLIARQDADFAPLANQPPFDAIIYPEKVIYSEKITYPEKVAYPEKIVYPEKKSW